MTPEEKTELVINALNEKLSKDRHNLVSLLTDDANQNTLNDATLLLENVIELKLYIQQLKRAYHK